jgi:hypothetical protein
MQREARGGDVGEAVKHPVVVFREKMGREPTIEESLALGFGYAAGRESGDAERDRLRVERDAALALLSPGQRRDLLARYAAHPPARGEGSATTSEPVA